MILNTKSYIICYLFAGKLLAFFSLYLRVHQSIFINLYLIIRDHDLIDLNSIGSDFNEFETYEQFINNLDPKMRVFDL